MEDYELACKMYTEGLEKLRDMPALYTNRAQVLNAILYVKHYAVQTAELPVSYD